MSSSIAKTDLDCWFGILALVFAIVAKNTNVINCSYACSIIAFCLYVLQEGSCYIFLQVFHPEWHLHIPNMLV